MDWKFLTVTPEARTQEQCLKNLVKNNCPPRFLFPPKLSIKYKGNTMMFLGLVRSQKLTSHHPCLRKLPEDMLLGNEGENQEEETRGLTRERQRIKLMQ